MSQQTVATTRRQIDEGWNRGNLAVFDETSTADYVGHDVQVGDLDLEGGKQLISTYRAAFPDLQYTIDDIIDGGDEVVVRWHAEGTFSHEMLGLKPTGRKGTVTGISINRFVGDKIAESWTQWDNLQYLRDIGALPSEVGASA